MIYRHSEKYQKTVVELYVEYGDVAPSTKVLSEEELREISKSCPPEKSLGEPSDEIDDLVKRINGKKLYLCNIDDKICSIFIPEMSLCYYIEKLKVKKNFSIKSYL